MSPNIRPSALPKLAACPCYEGIPGEGGPAAQRGTMLDGVFRSVMQGAELPGLEAEDAAALVWAVKTARDIAEDCCVLTADADCKVKLPNGMTGTCDGVIPHKWAHIDLKTGMRRNYMEQMAAYALGLMEEHFVSEWTAYLLFCDQKQVVVHRFNYKQAQDIVNGIVEVAESPTKVPTVCEYCSWCAKVETCPPRMAAMEGSLATTQETFAAILENPVRLGDFLEKAKVFEKFWDSAKEKARELLEAGAEVPGWKLQKGRTSKYVAAQHQADAIATGLIKLEAVLGAHGALSEKKFKEIWPKELPFPEVAESKTASKSLVQI
jgi:CRISPR/Cas system-associated exonuclease Cas4 (RecB family)